MKIKSYGLTTAGCFIGIFTEAVIVNLTPVLFVPMMRLYGLNFAQLGALIGINFAAQVSADLLFSGIIDRIGFRKVIIPANAMAGIGLLLFALTPVLFSGDIFVGLVVTTVIFSFASGLMEILYSPLITAIPHKDGGRAMGLLHSFYAWGQFGTVVITTLLLVAFGAEQWPVIVVLWAMIPLSNTVLFCIAPFPPAVPAEKRTSPKATARHPFYLAALAAICLGGAAEVTIGQWASSLMEVGLGLPKVTGDLVGMGGFAALMGFGRVMYGAWASKLDIRRLLTVSAAITAVLYVCAALLPPIPGLVACALCGLTTAMLWPGVLIVASDRFPNAGAWMFAILAFAGDLGAGFFPWLTGIMVEYSEGSAAAGWISRLTGAAAEQAPLRWGILCASVLAVGAAIANGYTVYRHKKEAAENANEKEGATPC